MSNSVVFLSVDNVGKVQMTTNQITNLAAPNQQTNQNITSSSLSDIALAGQTTMSGSTTVATAPPTTSNDSIANTAYVTRALQNLVDGSNNWANGINWKATSNSFTPAGTTNNLTINTSGIKISSATQNVTISGKTIFNGPNITVSTFTNNGLVHSDTSGVLSSSKLVDSDITIGTIQNNKLANGSSSALPSTIVIRDSSSYIYTATPLQGDNDNKAATTAYVRQSITDLIGSATSAYDTLKELEDGLKNASGVIGTLTNMVNTKADASSTNYLLSLKLDTSAISTSTIANSVVKRDANSYILSATALQSDSTDKAATTTYVTTAITNLIDNAGANFNTLGKLQTAILDSSNVLGNLITTVNTKADASSTNYLLSLKLNASAISTSIIADSVVQRDTSSYIYTTTAPQNDNDNKAATTSYVRTAISNLIGGASAAYDTLKELQDALVDSSSIIINLVNDVALKADASSTNYLLSLKLNASAVSTNASANSVVQRDSNSYIFTATAPQNDNSFKAATTSYVRNAISDLLGGASPAYDTLKELEDGLKNASGTIGSLQNMITLKSDTSSTNYLLSLKLNASAVSVNASANSVVQRDSNSYIFTVTAPQDDNSFKAATTAYADTIKTGLVGTATTSFNTLGKLETGLKNASGVIGDLQNTINSKADSSSVNYELSLRANASSVNYQLSLAAPLLTSVTTDSSQSITGPKTFTENILMTNATGPTNANHLATKAYVDANSGGGGGGITTTVAYNSPTLSNLYTLSKGASGYLPIKQPSTNQPVLLYQGIENNNAESIPGRIIATSWDGFYTLIGGMNTITVESDNPSTTNYESNVLLLRTGMSPVIPNGVGTNYNVSALYISTTGQYQLIIFKNINSTSTGSSSSKIFKSIDYGNNFSELSNSTLNNILSDTATPFLSYGCCISDDGQHIYIANTPPTSTGGSSNDDIGGLIMSHDGGTTFTYKNDTGFRKMTHICISKNGQYVYCVAKIVTGQVYYTIQRSPDYGSNWTQLSTVSNSLYTEPAASQPLKIKHTYSLSCSFDGRYVCLTALVLKPDLSNLYKLLCISNNFGVSFDSSTQLAYTSSAVGIPGGNYQFNVILNQAQDDSPGHVAKISGDGRTIFLASGQLFNISHSIIYGLQMSGSTSDGCFLSCFRVLASDSGNIYTNKRIFFGVPKAYPESNNYHLVPTYDLHYKNVTSVAISSKYIYWSTTGAESTTETTYVYKYSYNPYGQDWPNIVVDGTPNYNFEDGKIQTYYGGRWY